MPIFHKCNSPGLKNDRHFVTVKPIVQLVKSHHISCITYILVEQFPLEVEQEPAVAEVEVRVVAVRVHQLVQLAVQDLDEGPSRHRCI